MAFLCRIKHKWGASYSGGPLGIDTMRTCQRCNKTEKYMQGFHLDSGWMETTWH